MWHSRSSDDGGFSLVELLVTMVIIGTVLIGLIGVQLTAMRTVALSKQRQQAVGLANQAIEELRALPYLTVAGGLSTADLTGDPNIRGGLLQPGYSSAVNETLVTSIGQSTAPLYPHVQPSTSTKVGNTQYDVRVYVSLVGGSATAGYWLTAIVKWTSSVTKNTAKTVAVRSELFSPSGCLSTATHPFSGPCQAFLYGNAGTTPAGITLQPVDTANPQMMSDVDLQSAGVTLPEESVTAELEQALSAQGKATTSGGQATTSAGGQTAGNQAATSAADTDPGTGTPSGTRRATASQSSPNQLVFGPSAGQVVLTASPSDSGTSVSTTAAGSADGCNDVTGTALTNNDVCTSVSATPSGSASAAYRGYPLAAIAAGATSRSFAARFTAPGGIQCPTANGVGCISAGTALNIGTASVGAGLPGVPAGYSAMVSVANYAARSSAASGLGASSSPLRTRSGSLTYWGTDQAAHTVTLDSTTSSSIALGPVVSTAGQLAIAMSGTVTVSPTTTASTGPASCATACTQTTTVPSVSASVTFTFTQGGAQVAYFTLRLDLGTALTKATYKAAPSA